LIRQTSDAQLEATKAQTQHTQTQHEREKYSRCHQTFKTSTYEQFKDINPDRVTGTCQWFLSHPQYLRWLEYNQDDLLWISADPGCGKSVLAKSLIHNELRCTDLHIVCYFFFKDNKEQDSVATALCALLHQLFSHHPKLIHHAIPLWERDGDKLVNEVAELWRILITAATADQASNITCVLDALDECGLRDRQWLIQMLSQFYTKTISSSATKRRGRLKFLVTSRPYDGIQVEFQRGSNNLPTIRLRGEDENDQIHQEIDLVIRKRVGQLATDLNLDEETTNRIETRLLEMKHRTYLWLHLTLADVEETFKYSARPEEESIESLPTSVEHAYEKILSRVPEKHKGRVKKIFQIVVGARRPLHVDEMAIALGISTSTQLSSLERVTLRTGRLADNIRHWCGLFVFFNHGRIFLLHQTAKEFLLSENDGTQLQSGWKYCLSPCETEREMTRICVEFLAFDSVEAVARRLVSQFKRGTVLDEILAKDDYVQSFLAYAAEYWPSHLRSGCFSQGDLLEPRILELYQVENTLYNYWFRIFWQATRRYHDFPQMSPIRLGGLLGHDVILRSVLQLNPDLDVDDPDEYGRTALMWASEEGHEKAVQILLDHKADPNAQAQGGYGNALQAASAEGHEKVVQILLDHRVDPNVYGLFGYTMQAASAGGHEKVVQILLDYKADPNAQA
jgi:hypothetical protein